MPILIQLPYRGTVAWFVEWARPTSSGPWLVGRVRRLPTPADAMRIIRRWNITVIDGMPYHWWNGKLTAMGHAD